MSTRVVFVGLGVIATRTVAGLQDIQGATLSMRTGQPVHAPFHFLASTPLSHTLSYTPRGHHPPHLVLKHITITPGSLDEASRYVSSSAFLRRAIPFGSRLVGFNFHVCFIHVIIRPFHVPYIFLSAVFSSLSAYLSYPTNQPPFSSVPPMHICSLPCC